MKKLYITVDMFITLVEEAIDYFNFAKIEYSNYMIEDFILNKIRKDGYANFEIIYETKEKAKELRS